MKIKRGRFAAAHTLKRKWNVWLWTGLALMAPIAQAANCVWTGKGADFFWSTDANWLCGVMPVHPVNGDNVAFPHGAPQRQNINDLTRLHIGKLQINDPDYLIEGDPTWLAAGLSTNIASGNPVDFPPDVSMPLILSAAQTFSCTGAYPVRFNNYLETSGHALTIDGSCNVELNSIQLDGSITTGGAGTLLIDGPIDVTGDSTIYVVGADEVLDIPGVIGNSLPGSFTLTKSGLGRLRLENDNTFGGDIIVGKGVLELDGQATNLVVDSGVLTGGGSVSPGGITLHSTGAIAPGVGLAPATLSCDFLSWDANGLIELKLGATAARSDRVSINTGSLEKGLAGPFSFEFKDAATPPTPGVTYVLIEFPVQFGFAASDFSFNYGGAVAGVNMSGDFALSSTQLTFTPSVVHSDLIFRDGFE